jgi:hypothetical protein
MALRTAQADTIAYKFTGRDGVTAYSHTLPENDSPANVQTVKIESLPRVLWNRQRRHWTRRTWNAMVCVDWSAGIQMTFRFLVSNFPG